MLMMYYQQPVATIACVGVVHVTLSQPSSQPEFCQLLWREVEEEATEKQDDACMHARPTHSGVLVCFVSSTRLTG